MKHKKHLFKLITIPAIISALNFIVLILQSVSDGVITDQELHALIKASSGIDIIFLVIAITLLKR